MAFDNKRLKAFRWLYKIATKQQRNVKSTQLWCPYNHIYIRFGSLYATNGFILARVDYPEFEHVGDDCWKVVKSFVDDSGMHRKDIEFRESTSNWKMRDRIFSDVFPKSLHYDQCQPFNPHLIAECMYLFKLYGINPIISMDGPRISFSGHNKDVSIEVLTVGVNYE